MLLSCTFIEQETVAPKVVFYLRSMPERTAVGFERLGVGQLGVGPL